MTCVVMGSHDPHQPSSGRVVLPGFSEVCDFPREQDAIQPLFERTFPKLSAANQRIARGKHRRCPGRRFEGGSIRFGLPDDTAPSDTDFDFRGTCQPPIHPAVAVRRRLLAAKEGPRGAVAPRAPAQHLAQSEDSTHYKRASTTLGSGTLRARAASRRCPRTVRQALDRPRSAALHG